MLVAFAKATEGEADGTVALTPGAAYGPLTFPVVLLWGINYGTYGVFR